MATAKVKYIGSLRTENIHLQSGTIIETDAPTDNNGKGERFSPTDLTATSLCDCMLTIMGVAAKEHGFSIDGACAEVEKVMSDKPPRCIVKIVVKVDFTMCTLNDKQRRILNAVPPLCPVALSLHPSIIQDVQLKFE